MEWVRDAEEEIQQVTNDFIGDLQNTSLFHELEISLKKMKKVCKKMPTFVECRKK